MNNREDDAEKELRHHTNGGTTVAGSREIVTDVVQDSEETDTVPSIEERLTGAHPVQVDQVFEVLQNQRRRSVLRYLQTVDDEVRLGTLAEQIAAQECDKDVSQITSQERKRVYVALYQSHLPKMDDIGAISYNKPRGKIKSGENKQIFEHYLSAETDDNERAWIGYYWALPLIVSLLTLVLAIGWFLS